MILCGIYLYPEENKDEHSSSEIANDFAKVEKYTTLSTYSVHV